jgi:hypothetical protein
MLDSGCPRHTFLDKDGVRKPAHLLIECREFLHLNRALQERMGSEQPVAGAIAYNAPPPPLNPPANVAQQGHQATMIQQVEQRQPANEEEEFPPPRGFMPMIQRGAPNEQSSAKVRKRSVSRRTRATCHSRIPELVRASDWFRPVRSSTEDPTPRTPRFGPRGIDRGFHL